MLRKIKKNRVIRNAGWIIGGKLANKVLAFVVGIFAARYLGPSNYGLINYASAYATFFASLCTLGINNVIVKNFVDHPAQEGETIGTTLLLRALSSLLSALAMIGIVSVVDMGERLTIVVTALYSIGLVSGLRHAELLVSGAAAIQILRACGAGLLCGNVDL